MNSVDRVDEHYTHGSLLETIDQALAAAGIDPQSPRAEDLAAVEEFHTGGRDATLHICRALGVRRGSRVLDIGCGIGGPARTVARETGAHVVGVDATAEYCAVATELSRRCDLDELTEFHHANALDLPFTDGSFDAAMILHVGMNIEDKAGLFEEIGRVLGSGGTLVVYDILDLGRGGAYYPAPWAADATMSFLVTPSELKERLEAAGFAVESEEDCTQFARDFFTKMSAAAEEGRVPPVGLLQLMGSSGPERLGNIRRAVEEDRVAPWRVVGRGPA